MTLIQHPSQTDFEEVLKFLIQCDIAEFGEPDTSREDYEESWSEMDLGCDAWLARDAQGHIIGYASVYGGNDRFMQDLTIHPVLSPKSLEHELLKKSEERIREVISKSGLKPVVIGYASVLNQRLHQVFEEFGFNQYTRHYRMQIDFYEPPESPVWPTQYTLSAFKPEDELELFQLIQSAFDWEGRTKTSLEDWRNALFRGGRYDPELFIMVRESERIVGAILSYGEEEKGWIRQIAVAKDHQGRGLGSLMLRHAFTVYSQRGSSGVALGVSSKNTNACHFYERSGMYRSREFIEFQKEYS